MKLITISSAALVAMLTVGAFAQVKPKLPKTKFTAVQAAKVATAKYPGKVSGKVNLENEDGHWQWEVIVRQGKRMREVNVDATTGKIANVETVTAKEEAAEKAADKKKKG